MSPEVISALATAFSSVVLAGLTAFYVWQTARMLKEMTIANTLQRDIADKQFRVMTVPHLFCGLSGGSSGPVLVVYNLGQVPAYDVDVLAIGIQSQDSLDVVDFVESQIRPDKRSTPLKPDDEGLYGVYDRVIHAVLPFGKKAVTQLTFPLPSETYYLFLQYRSMLGENYSQLYFFFEDADSAGDQAYQLGDLDPEVIEPATRVNLISDQAGLRLTTDVGSLPAHVIGKFANLLQHSIPAAFTVAQSEAAEERGSLENV